MIMLNFILLLVAISMSSAGFQWYHTVFLFNLALLQHGAVVVSLPSFNYSCNASTVSYSYEGSNCDFLHLQTEGIDSSYNSTGHDFIGAATDSSFEKMMTNHTLKVAVMFTTMDSLFQAHVPNGSLANIYGSSNVAYAFLLDLQEIFQFRIQIVPSVGWISEGVNGALTGVGAQVHFGQADIGLDLSKPVVYRAKHLTFLHAIKQDRVAIMFRQPEIQMYRNILAKPFKDGVWKGALQSFLAIFLSTSLIYRRRDVHSILLPIAGTMLARGVNWADSFRRSSNSLHTVVFISSLFGLTMYSIYSAFIVSSLRRAAPPVRRFQHLIDFEYELLAQRSLPDFTNVFLKDPVQGGKYAAIAKHNFINEKNSLQRLFLPNDNNATVPETANDDDDESRSGAGVAWFVLKSDFYYLALQSNYTTKEICDISKLEPTKRSEHPRLLAMYIAKRSRQGTTVPLNGSEGMKEHFNRRILDILARGLGHRHVLRFESEFQPKCLRTKWVKVQQIRFYDVYAAYWVLCCGACIAVGIMLMLEVLNPYCWKVTEEYLAGNNNKYQLRETNFIVVRKSEVEMEQFRRESMAAGILW